MALAQSGVGRETGVPTERVDVVESKVTQGRIHNRFLSVDQADYELAISNRWFGWTRSSVPPRVATARRLTTVGGVSCVPRPCRAGRRAGWTAAIDSDPR